jgi:2-oxoglutarate ferredoxin oxidoreductase subunit gamma
MPADKHEVRIAGYGGQGVVLSGVLLGRACVLHAGKHAIQTQTYGAAARGGAARSDVIISDSPIIYPQVTKPTAMVAFNNVALDKYIGTLAEGALLIIDEGLVTPPDNDGGKFIVHSIAATKHAAEACGRKLVANMVMLGFLNGLAGIVDQDALEHTIRAGVPAGTEDMNIEAFRIGASHAEESR